MLTIIHVFDKIVKRSEAREAAAGVKKRAQILGLAEHELMQLLNKAVERQPLLDMWNRDQASRAVMDVIGGDSGEETTVTPSLAALSATLGTIRRMTDDEWMEFLAEGVDEAGGATPALRAALLRHAPIPEQAAAMDSGAPTDIQPRWRRVPLKNAAGSWFWVGEGLDVLLSDEALSSLGAPRTATNTGKIDSIDRDGTIWVVPDYASAATGGRAPAVPVGLDRATLARVSEARAQPIQNVDDVMDWYGEHPQSKRAGKQASKRFPGLGEELAAKSTLGAELRHVAYAEDPWDAAAELAMRRDGCLPGAAWVVLAQKGPWTPGPSTSVPKRTLKERVWVPGPGGEEEDIAGGSFRTWKDIKDNLGVFKVDPRDRRYSPPSEVSDRHRELLTKMKDAPPERTVLPRALDLMSPVELKQLRNRGKDEINPKKVENERRGVQNILAVYNLATPEERDYWKHWYPYGHATAEALAKKYDTSVALAAGVIAVLSPQMLWENNVAAAEKALARDWEGLKGGQGLPPNKSKAYSLVENGDFSAVSGPKIEPFFWSLLYPEKFEERVVVDTHAANIWRGVREGEAWSLSIRLREKMERDYREAAQAVGLSPQALQAVTWIVWRRIPTGRKKESESQHDAAAPIGIKEMQRWLDLPNEFAIISAYKIRPKSKNQESHGDLMAELQRRGYPPSAIRALKGQYFEAPQRDSPLEGEMKAEQSILILDMPFTDAQEIAGKFGQESFIYKSADGVIGSYFSDGSGANLAVSPKNEPAVGSDATVIKERAPKPEHMGPPSPEDPWSKARNIGFEFPIDWKRKFEHTPGMPLSYQEAKELLSGQQAPAPA